MKDQIANIDQALDAISEISRSPRTSWITKGSRAKSNGNIEISRGLAKELASKTLCFYQVVGQLTYDPFCNCKQIESLLLNAVQELPDGDTADELEQITFAHCPSCGKKFED
ncbi:MAG TPA: hypothetical protein VFC84_00290 [Desulfosporosinus sp.]|nr:hypothetical protein [Desulfosporosinus sp.]